MNETRIQLQTANIDLAVVGVARNCAHSLQRDVAALEAATRAFRRVHFLVVESDSTDGSVEVLTALNAAMPNFRYLALGSLSAAHPKRTDRIARCRNAYLEELRSNPLYAAVSHVLVTDLDGVSRDIDAAALGTCWASEVPWSACTANQGDVYYDIYALRHPFWCPVNVWREHAALKPLLGRRAADDICVFSRMVHIDASRPMIEVESAFGGMAVYRRDALLAAHYVGLSEDGEEVCEHVALHATMRARGSRIFINPALINARTTRHGRRKHWLRKLRRRVRSWLKGGEDLL